MCTTRSSPTACTDPLGRASARSRCCGTKPVHPSISAASRHLNCSSPPSPFRSPRKQDCCRASRNLPGVDRAGSDQRLRSVIDPGLAELDVEGLLGELCARARAALGAEVCTVVLADGSVHGDDDEALCTLARRSIAESELVTDPVGAAVPLTTHTGAQGALALPLDHL